jgi:hypothetical protein
MTVAERRSCPLCGETANQPLLLTRAANPSESLGAEPGENLTVTAHKAAT